MPKQKSDLSRAFSEDGTLKTHVGGQALIEGIMMRGKLNWAVAVREPAGTIYTEEHDLASGRPENSWLRWPIVRGCTAFVESLALGYKALEIAAMHAFDDSDDTADAEAEPAAGEGANLSTVDFTADGSDLDRPFSWKNDFGSPDRMVDALGAQRELKVVSESADADDAAKGGTAAATPTSRRRMRPAFRSLLQTRRKRLSRSGSRIRSS